MTPEEHTRKLYEQQLHERGYSPRRIAKEIKTMQSSATSKPTPLPSSEAIITTVSGRRVDLRNPRPGMFAIEDIAHGLAAVCRFSGQTSFFYSVAEHSIMVAQAVPPRAQLRAILHDASEAYMQDIPTPLKAMLPVYRAMEHHVMQAIFDAFGVEPNEADDADVHRADRMAAAVEIRDLFRGGFPPEASREAPANVRIREPRKMEDVVRSYLELFQAAQAWRTSPTLV